LAKILMRLLAMAVRVAALLCMAGSHQETGQPIRATTEGQDLQVRTFHRTVLLVVVVVLVKLVARTDKVKVEMD
jgi:hypothetical protein